MAHRFSEVFIMWQQAGLRINHRLCLPLDLLAETSLIETTDYACYIRL